MRTARLMAIAVFSERWHGGQWSRLYRMGCRARTLLLKLGIREPLPLGLGRTPPAFRGAFRAQYRRLWPYRLKG